MSQKGLWNAFLIHLHLNSLPFELPVQQNRDFVFTDQKILRSTPCHSHWLVYIAVDSRKQSLPMHLLFLHNHNTGCNRWPSESSVTGDSSPCRVNWVRQSKILYLFLFFYRDGRYGTRYRCCIIRTLYKLLCSKLQFLKYIVQS